MEYDLNGATIDESHKDHLHLETRSSRTTLANLRSTTQRRNAMFLDKKDEQDKPLSTGGGVAVIIALAGKLDFHGGGSCMCQKLRSCSRNRIDCIGDCLYCISKAIRSSIHSVVVSQWTIPGSGVSRCF